MVAISSLPDMIAISSMMGLEGASSGAYFRGYSKMLSQDSPLIRGRNIRHWIRQMLC
ncbi:MAG: hypothetical protein IBX40_12830 [Methanosarcinales archaeon]|nr:hypothetical protein [Methanosarcinales archaeon]